MQYIIIGFIAIFTCSIYCSISLLARMDIPTSSSQIFESRESASVGSLKKTNTPCGLIFLSDCQHLL